MNGGERFGYRVASSFSYKERIVMAKLWGGRFQKSAEAWVDEFGASIGFDQQLVLEDIEGSVAHAIGLVMISNEQE